VSLGFCNTAYDVSRVACELLSSSTQNFPDDRVHVVNGEIEEYWLDGDMDSDGTLVYCAMQFLQVLKKPKMKRIMRRLGSLLDRKPSGFSRPERVVYIVHPFNKDNCGPREWNGRFFPGVEWGDTTPYEEEDFLSAIGNNSIEMKLLGVHKYYHQTYSFLKFRKSRQV
jgi:hypothetical protein